MNFARLFVTLALAFPLVSQQTHSNGQTLHWTDQTWQNVAHVCGLPPAAQHDEIATSCSPKMLAAAQAADKQGRMQTAINEYGAVLYMQNTLPPARRDNKLRDAAAQRILQMKAAAQALKK